MIALRLVEEELHRAVAAAGHHLLGVRGRIAAAGGEEAALPGCTNAIGGGAKWLAGAATHADVAPVHGLQHVDAGQLLIHAHGVGVHVPHAHGAVQGGGQKEICPCRSYYDTVMMVT